MVKQKAWRGWQQLRRRPVAWGSGGLLLALTLLCLATPLLPLERPDNARTQLAYAAPTWEADDGIWHRDWKVDELALQRLFPWDRQLVRWREAWFGDRSLAACFGRDSLGRCLLSRICWGARVSLAVGFFAAVISLLVGVTYGAYSGFIGGWVDNLLMRFVDVFYGIPFIFIVIFLITMLRGQAGDGGKSAGFNLVVFFLVIGYVYWLTMARVTRGQVVSLREQEFVTAARALGGGSIHVLVRHLLPNLLPIVIVYLTLTVPRVMLFEAFLSFLGLGVEAPDVSWGVLVREAFEVLNPVRIVWWLVVWPSVFLALTLWSLNLLGDCLRDALDPRSYR